MGRLIEFIGNNLLWVCLWVAILLLLIWNYFGDILLGITQLEPADVTRRINHENATLIDLRGPDEHGTGHILNSMNIPDPQMPDRKAELVKFKKKPLILYCQNGSISARAVKILKADGFEDVSSMKGGILSWQRAGLPLTRSKA